MTVKGLREELAKVLKGLVYDEFVVEWLIMALFLKSYNTQYEDRA